MFSLARFLVPRVVSRTAPPQTASLFQNTSIISGPDAMRRFRRSGEPGTRESKKNMVEGPEFERVAAVQSVGRSVRGTDRLGYTLPALDRNNRTSDLTAARARLSWQGVEEHQPPGR